MHRNRSLQIVAFFLVFAPLLLVMVRVLNNDFTISGENYEYDIEYRFDYSPDSIFTIKSFVPANSFHQTITFHQYVHVEFP